MKQVKNLSCNDAISNVHPLFRLSEINNISYKKIISKYQKLFFFNKTNKFSFFKKPNHFISNKKIFLSGFIQLLALSIEIILNKLKKFRKYCQLF